MISKIVLWKLISIMEAENKSTKAKIMEVQYGSSIMEAKNQSLKAEILKVEILKTKMLEAKFYNQT